MLAGRIICSWELQSLLDQGSRSALSGYRYFTVGSAELYQFRHYLRNSECVRACMESPQLGLDISVLATHRGHDLFVMLDDDRANGRIGGSLLHGCVFRSSSWPITRHVLPAVRDGGTGSLRSLVPERPIGNAIENGSPMGSSFALSLCVQLTEELFLPLPHASCTLWINIISPRCPVK